MTVPALSIRGARKSFGGVQALRGVDLTVGPGEIHALLGENGAGKSTVIKLLAGIYAADEGAFEICGQSLSSAFTPQDVAAAGVRFVHQDFGLVDSMSVMENIAFVAGFPKRYGLIDYAACAARARVLLDALGLEVPVDTELGHLPHAEKAIVALARAIQGEARVIVLDEVTASLPSPDAARVHKAIRAARDKGIAFVYVSHRLEEVFDLCDQLTVLRDGAKIAAADVADVTVNQVIEWIAGKTMASHRRPAGSVRGETRLGVSGLTGGAIQVPADLTVRAGEIVGLTGIIGSGYDQLCEYVCGLAQPQTGDLLIDDQPVAMGATRATREAGLEIISGDRTAGAFPERTVRENIFADALSRRDGRPDLSGERVKTDELIAAFGVRPTQCREAQIQSLSGGNQQKVLFARAMMHRPGILVLIDPTAGVDIGARGDLHDLLRAAAQEGTAILFGSSDFEEIVAIADRVLVVRDGRIGAEVPSDEITWERLFAEAHSGHGHSTAA